VKKIEAIIQPNQLDETKVALHGAGMQGITVTDVRGRRRQKGHTETYRGQKYTIDLLPIVLLPMVKLEMVIPGADLKHTGDGAL
jgi:nitrogen regulatory protein P-II 1